MEKLTIEDIANILVERNSLSKEAAVLFATQLFAVVQAGLNRDKIVKVKGLGTFKIIDVEARESINVNTGERVLIDSHGKISFTPDSMMKELVNKPFSQFETVVLNDGVTFDEMPADEEDEDIQQEEKMQEEKPREEEQQEEQAAAPAQAASSEPAPASPASIDSIERDERDESAEKSAPEEKAADKVVPEESAEQSPFLADDEEESPSNNDTTKWIVFGVISLVLIALAACAGYIYGLNKGRAEARALQDEQPIEKPKAEPQSKDSLLVELHPEEPVVLEDNAKVKADSINVAKAKANQAQTNAKETETKAKQAEKPKEIEQKQAQKPTESSDKYEKMDARVRTGAYRIVGVDRTVTVKKGETVKRISKTYLGDGMECYVEVLNGLSGNAELKEGSKLKIPKLELKKKGK